MIARTSLHDQVIARVREMIVEGELAPGSRISERIICERLQISRTPLREALKVLASEGLVELSLNRGARVTPLTARNVREMFEVMSSLEALAGELACERISDAEIAEIAALHERMTAYHAKHDLPAYFRLNQEIHQRIMSSAENELLQNLYASLSVRIMRARYFANTSDARWDEAMHEHEEILTALRRRDGIALSALLREHLKHKCAAVIESLQDEAETHGTDVA